MALERHADHGGHAFTRDVVGGRAEAARRDDDAVFASEAAENALDCLAIVGDDHGLGDLVTDEGQLLAQPRRVGIRDLAARELGADAEDCRRHLSCIVVPTFADRQG
jgi:hypothetical protein